jgi:hypothetical protein
MLETRDHRNRQVMWPEVKIKARALTRDRSQTLLECVSIDAIADEIGALRVHDPGFASMIKVITIDEENRIREARSETLEK